MENQDVIIINNLLKDTVARRIKWKNIFESDQQLTFKYVKKLTKKKKLQFTLTCRREIRNTYLNIVFIKEAKDSSFVRLITPHDCDFLLELASEVMDQFNNNEIEYLKIEESVQNNNIPNRSHKLKSIRLISNLNKDTELDTLKWREKKNEDGSISYYTSYQITPQKKLMFLLKSKNGGSLTDNILTCSLKKEDNEKKSSSSVLLRASLKEYPSLIQLLKILNKKYSGLDFNIDMSKGYKESPFIDKLKFENDGPLFKCGDRVTVDNYLSPNNRTINNEHGIIVNYLSHNSYLVCFDNNIGGYSFEKNNVPLGHGLYLNPKFIKLTTNKETKSKEDDDTNTVVKNFMSILNKINNESKEPIKYGSDGPKFKCKDRVTYINVALYGEKGTVITYNGKFYLIYFDKEIHDRNAGTDLYNIPIGHGQWVEAENLEKIKDDDISDDKKFKKGDRVICRNYEAYDSKKIINGTGKIIHVQKNYYLIYFDQDVNGHPYPSFKIPDGHGYYVHPICLELLDDSYSPFINSLKFGNNGPDFKCGDRISYKGFGKNAVYGEKGIVVTYKNESKRYLVCLDIGYSGISVPEYGVPNGKGLYLIKDDIKKI